MHSNFSPLRWAGTLRHALLDHGIHPVKQSIAVPFSGEEGAPGYGHGHAAVTARHERLEAWWITQITMPMTGDRAKLKLAAVLRDGEPLPGVAWDPENDRPLVEGDYANYGPSYPICMHLPFMSMRTELLIGNTSPDPITRGGVILHVERFANIPGVPSEEDPEWMVSVLTALGVDLSPGAVISI